LRASGSVGLPLALAVGSSSCTQQDERSPTGTGSPSPKLELALDGKPLLDVATVVPATIRHLPIRALNSP
jgi:hypothetical protein